MNTKQEATTLFRFLSVGVLNTAIDLGIFNLLRLAGSNSYIAASISFLIATINSYAWNRSWTFQHIDKQAILPQFSLFLVSNIVGLAINNLLQHQALVFFGDNLLIANVAKIAAIALVVLWNYGVSRFVIFRPVTSKD